MLHKELSGEQAVHQSAYVQTTDPGAVGALKDWYDTSTTPAAHKVRNATNDGWLLVGIASGITADDLATKADLTDGKVPLSQIPDTVIGGLDYQGVWNASTNTPSLTTATPVKGDYYKVSVAGSTSLSGITDWAIGDWAVYNGTAWDKVDNSEVASASGNLDSLTDVVITTPGVGQVLKFNGTSWVNSEDEGGSSTPAPTTATTSRALTADEELVLASGTITLSLPDASTGRVDGYIIKNVGTGTITIAAATGNDIDSLASIDTDQQWDAVQLRPVGANSWRITTPPTGGGGSAEHDHNDLYVRTVNGTGPDVDGNVVVAGGGSFDPRTSVEDDDDFFGGTTTSGQIGKLGWLNSGSISLATECDAGHPGHVDKSTTATSGNYSYLWLGSQRAIAPQDYFDLYWCAKILTNNTTSGYWFGLQHDWSWDPVHTGFFIEKPRRSPARRVSGIRGLSSRGDPLVREGVRVVVRHATHHPHQLHRHGARRRDRPRPHRLYLGPQRLRKRRRPRLLRPASAASTVLPLPLELSDVCLVVHGACE